MLGQVTRARAEEIVRELVERRRGPAGPGPAVGRRPDGAEPQGQRGPARTWSGPRSPTSWRRWASTAEDLAKQVADILQALGRGGPQGHHRRCRRRPGSTMGRTAAAAKQAAAPGHRHPQGRPSGAGRKPPDAKTASQGRPPAKKPGRRRPGEEDRPRSRPQEGAAKKSAPRRRRRPRKPHPGRRRPRRPPARPPVRATDRRAPPAARPRAGPARPGQTTDSRPSRPSRADGCWWPDRWPTSRPGWCRRPSRSSCGRRPALRQPGRREAGRRARPLPVDVGGRARPRRRRLHRRVHRLPAPARRRPCGGRRRRLRPAGRPAPRRSDGSRCSSGPTSAHLTPVGSLADGARRRPGDGRSVLHLAAPGGSGPGRADRAGAVPIWWCWSSPSSRPGGRRCRVAKGSIRDPEIWRRALGDGGLRAR